eukprot:1955412-Pyramimonas_sp.AAC.1
MSVAVEVHSWGGIVTFPEWSLGASGNESVSACVLWGPGRLCSPGPRNGWALWPGFWSSEGLPGPGAPARCARASCVPLVRSATVCAPKPFKFLATPPPSPAKVKSLGGCKPTACT